MSVMQVVQATLEKKLAEHVERIATDMACCSLHSVAVAAGTIKRHTTAGTEETQSCLSWHSAVAVQVVQAILEKELAKHVERTDTDMAHVHTI
jgi:hypothetical protein